MRHDGDRSNTSVALVWGGWGVCLGAAIWFWQVAPITSRPLRWLVGSLIVVIAAGAALGLLISLVQRLEETINNWLTATAWTLGLPVALICLFVGETLTKSALDFSMDAPWAWILGLGSGAAGGGGFLLALFGVYSRITMAEPRACHR